MQVEENSQDSFIVDPEKVVKVIYTNWRGQTAHRSIIPISMRWGSTEWHKKEQWLLKVWDVERNDYREYAFKDIQKWG